MTWLYTHMPQSEFMCQNQIFLIARSVLKPNPSLRTRQIYIYIRIYIYIYIYIYACFTVSICVDFSTTYPIVWTWFSRACIGVVLIQSFVKLLLHPHLDNQVICTMSVNYPWSIWVKSVNTKQRQNKTMANHVHVLMRYIFAYCR